MKKIDKKTKKLILITGALVAVLLLGGVSYVYFKGAKEIRDADNLATEEITQNNSVEDGGNTDSPATEEPTTNTETPKVAYDITGVNKKDGDVLAIPDDLTFSISPKVDKTIITVKDASGKVLYTVSKAISSGTVTVYPSGKPSEGSAGTLTLEGYVDDSIVASKIIRIIF